ncbi:bifunctional riboflavin kinase/FAD synthetase [Ectothiorhodospiraceae bacterium 2226]|nr:bifunctional riboflavin kinase/FAD synthetase [Ectothiorhodospiraceae bacterium 2226]
MELIRGLHNLRARHRGCAATIGNFDGVHRGHQVVLQRLHAEAERLAMPATVIIFEPQPREFFAPAAAPARLTRLREKLMQLAAQGAERVLCLRFDAALAGLSAEAFIQRVLVEGLGVRYVMLGDDFRFGRDRAGDFELLQAVGQAAGFAVERTPGFELDGRRVSSTRVREALGAGELETAARLLGRPYAMAGRVAHGDKRGRSIGFPTANIALHRPASPVQGVFAVHLCVDGEQLPGVANVGTRPTVGGTRVLLEVHVLDFEGDLYGRHVEVAFLRKLRPEMRFESFDALRAQIATDVEAARAYFAHAPH